LLLFITPREARIVPKYYSSSLVGQTTDADALAAPFNAVVLEARPWRLIDYALRWHVEPMPELKDDRVCPQRQKQYGADEERAHDEKDTS
jgi:hypothetical protein